MAIVPGLGTVFAGEHGRSARVKGQRRSYHFRIEETMGFNDLPGMRQRYWRTDHPDAEYADFLKVRWMSVADGDDGHAVCRGGRTVAAPGKTELVLRLEESYIPAYMLLDVIRVFHVSELARELNLDGQSDVFFVAAREGDKFSREPLPPDEHKTFPVPLDFLDEPIITSTLTEMLSTVKMLLRRVVQAKLYTKSDRSLDSVPLHWPWPWWVLLRDMFEGARSTSTTRTRTHVESDASHVARKRKEQHDAQQLTFETEAELHCVAQVLGDGWGVMQNRESVKGAFMISTQGAACAVEPADCTSMRVIRAHETTAEVEGPKAKKPRGRGAAPPGLRIVWSKMWGGSLSVAFSWVNETHFDLKAAEAAAV